MFVRTFAGAVAGIDAVAVTVEVNIAGGGLGMYLVGLPDNCLLYTSPSPTRRS